MVLVGECTADVLVDTFVHAIFCFLLQLYVEKCAATIAIPHSAFLVLLVCVFFFFFKCLSFHTYYSFL